MDFTNQFTIFFLSLKKSQTIPLC